MWLPEPLYESLPYLYVVCGALIVGGAIYVGIGTSGAPYYVLIGILSILGGVVIYLRRMTARKGKSDSEITSAN
jgi:glucose dehydrogenase